LQKISVSVIISRALTCGYPALRNSGPQIIFLQL
jgi:hypothetical protein